MYINSYPKTVCIFLNTPKDFCRRYSSTSPFFWPYTLDANQQSSSHPHVKARLRRYNKDLQRTLFKDKKNLSGFFFFSELVFTTQKERAISSDILSLEIPHLVGRTQKSLNHFYPLRTVLFTRCQQLSCRSTGPLFTVYSADTNRVTMRVSCRSQSQKICLRHAITFTNRLSTKHSSKHH